MGTLSKSLTASRTGSTKKRSAKSGIFNGQLSATRSHPSCCPRTRTMIVLSTQPPPLVPASPARKADVRTREEIQWAPRPSTRMPRIREKRVHPLSRGMRAAHIRVKLLRERSCGSSGSYVVSSSVRERLKGVAGERQDADRGRARSSCHSELFAASRRAQNAGLSAAGGAVAADWKCRRRRSEESSVSPFWTFR
jgi:hypothetical protein